MKFSVVKGERVKHNHCAPESPLGPMTPTDKDVSVCFQFQAYFFPIKTALSQIRQMVIPPKAYM